MKSLNGGYVMVDFGGADFANIGDGVTIAGIYAKLLAALNTGKPIYGYNVLNSTNDIGLYSPVIITAAMMEDGETIAADFVGLSVEVGTDDTFRVAE